MLPEKVLSIDLLFFFLPPPPGEFWIQETNQAGVTESCALLPQWALKGRICAPSQLCTSPHGMSTSEESGFFGNNVQ